MQPQDTDYWFYELCGKTKNPLNKYNLTDSSSTERYTSNLTHLQCYMNFYLVIYLDHAQHFFGSFQIKVAQLQCQGSRYANILGLLTMQDGSIGAGHTCYFNFQANTYVALIGR